MLAYVRLEVLRQLRSPEMLLFRLGLPAGLYVLFRTVLATGSDGTSEGLPSDVASMVVFAVLGAAYSGVFATGPTLAQERAIGWLRQLRVTPLPPASLVAGKVAAAMTYALPSIALVAVVASLTQDVSLGLGRWVELVAMLWIATGAFAALGVLIGLSIANPEASTSAASAVLIVLWVLGGMITTPSDLPGALETLAHAMPTNGAAELGWAAARGDGIPLAAATALVGWTVAFGALAALAWRRLGGAR